MSGVREIALSEVGLETCAQAAERRGCDPATVRRWVGMGWVPAVVVGAGRTTVYLVRAADVDAFTPPPKGRPKKEPTPAAGKKPGKAKKK